MYDDFELILWKEIGRCIDEGYMGLREHLENMQTVCELLDMEG